GEPQASDPGDGAGLAHEPRQLVAGCAIAVTAEVDPRQDDLAVAVLDTAADLVQDRCGGTAARSAADERNHAEVAGETAAVLDLHEGADSVEPRVRLDAADRTHIAGDERRRLFASPIDDRDVGG